MAVSDGNGGAGRYPGNSPERGRGGKRKLNRGSETEKVGDGAAVGGAVIPRALQRSREKHLLSGYLMTLSNKEIISAMYVALNKKVNTLL